MIRNLSKILLILWQMRNSLAIFSFEERVSRYHFISIVLFIFSWLNYFTNIERNWVWRLWFATRLIQDHFTHCSELFGCVRDWRVLCLIRSWCILTAEIYWRLGFHCLSLSHHIIVGQRRIAIAILFFDFIQESPSAQFIFTL